MINLLLELFWIWWELLIFSKYYCIYISYSQKLYKSTNSYVLHKILSVSQKQVSIDRTLEL